MVDFNKDTTITGRNAIDIMRVIIMERRYNLFEAIEYYIKLESEQAQSSVDVAIVKARAYTLFMEIQQIMYRRIEPKDMAVFLSNLKSDKYKDIMLAVDTMCEVMDDISLTKLDNKKVYDRTRVEDENKAKNI